MKKLEAVVVLVIGFSIPWLVCGLGLWLYPVEYARADHDRPNVFIQGKIVVGTPQRYVQPVYVAPGIAPAARVGFEWHWHPHYGWVSLRTGVFVGGVVLPANYVLPAQVPYYAPVYTIICPNCGQVIEVPR